MNNIGELKHNGEYYPKHNGEYCPRTSSCEDGQRVCVSCLQTELCDFRAKCTFLLTAEDGEAWADCRSERKPALLLYTPFCVESKRLLQEWCILFVMLVSGALPHWLLSSFSSVPSGLATYCSLLDSLSLHIRLSLSARRDLQYTRSSALGS